MATFPSITIPSETTRDGGTIAQDPALAAIEAHRTAEAQFMEALDHLAAVEKSVGSGVSHPLLAAAHQREDVTGSAADDAAMELAATRPTTLAGAVAVLDYVATYAETSRDLPEDFATRFYRTLGTALTKMPAAAAIA